MDDVSSPDPAGPPSPRPRLLPPSLRRRWVLVATAAVIGVNAIVLGALPGLGSASSKQCGGGSGSGGAAVQQSGSGGSGGECLADLALQIFPSVKSIGTGHRLFYLVQITNSGPDFSEGPRVIVLLPKTTSTLWALSSQGECYVNQQLHVADCFMYFLNPHEKAAVTVVLVPKQEGTIELRAGVSQDFPKDPNKGNNTAKVDTIVTK